MSAWLQTFKWSFFLACILYFLFCVIEFPPRNGLTKIQIAQGQSDIQLVSIGKLVLDYRNKHQGNSPERWSEILPNDEPESEKPSRLIDSYVLDPSANYELSSKSNSGILIFEKSGLWSDGSVAVCFDNLTVKRLTQAEFDVLNK